VIQALDLRALRSCGWARCDGQGVHGKGKEIVRQGGVEQQKRLTRNTERQLHTRKHDKLPVPRQGLAGGVGFFGCGLPHIPHERHVVMIGDRNPLKTAISAGLYEPSGIGKAAFVADRVRASPIAIARSVNLKIAAEKVSSPVSHAMSVPPSTLRRETLNASAPSAGTNDCRSCRCFCVVPSSRELHSPPAHGAPDHGRLSAALCHRHRLLVGGLRSVFGDLSSRNTTWTSFHGL